jgi:Response regulator containing CheY-like receiver, AAA-type ATPase, and DNA-binding domains
MRTILVVEDDFDTLYPLAELLRLKGHTAITASNAEQALRTARETKPDLIITDIVLPGKSGLQFIATIRNDAALKAIPIMVISGCGPMILVEAETIGADMCLEKPINIELFWNALQGLLESKPDQGDSEQVSGNTTDRRTAAAEIDRLVEQLRYCSSKQEREDMLKKLKQCILEMQALRKSCA